MSKFTGTVKRNDLEGGFWELHADDGARYQLTGGDDALRKQGQKVAIDGSVDRKAVSVGMTGPILNVKSYKKL